MKITRDTLGHLENPNFILMKASGERVGVLKCTAKQWTEKYNDMNTLSFEIPFMSNDELTPFYDDIDIMKYIEVPSMSAAFAIKDISIENEGQKTEFKKVECQSRECELGQKYLEELSINTGLTGAIDGVKFYQPGNQPYSLLHIVLSEKCPGWSISHVSAGLWSMQRSFEVTRQDIYSFLMTDITEAFECIFVFDSLNRTISAYTESEYGHDTSIHVSYNNLLENTSMDYSIDEVKTCITLKGESDDVTVREICMGYDRIYDFSVYASEEYMSQSLLDAYNAWQRLIVSAVDTSLFTYKTGVITVAELRGKSYKDAYTYLLNKYQKYYTSLSEWYNTKLPYLINTRKNPGYGTISYTEDGSDAVTFDRQSSTELVTSLPSTGNNTVLYLIKNSSTWDMYRWNGKWVHVNHWYECALAELKTLQASAENQQAVAMKAGYGDSESLDANIRKRYVDTYLPAYYMYNALCKQIDTVKATIASLESDQAIIEKDKLVITNKTAMKNNFTTAQLKELSTFIREDELSSSNYVITDTMTEDEKFEMLYALLDYGQRELAKVSSPQIQFSASLVNLFAIPEFDDYSGDFDLGNYIWVTLRDDYSIKAKILEISVDFLDQSNFSVTFGNIMKKARNIFTDVTDALNAATSAATSVSFGASHWSAAAENTDEIGKALADGLLSQQYYLANAEDNETRIDENGVWITTTTGSHGRESTDNYDAIYLGGGRILYTEDGWRTITMSVGRADVSMPSINSSGQLIYTTESKFGVFADFVIAGYIGGSLIVGGDIYSANYKTSSNKNSGNAGTHINLTDGTFEFNSKSTGKKRLFMSDSVLEVNGTIQAQKGHIGCDDNGEGGFIIDSLKMYNGKSGRTIDAAGIYLGTDGIGLGRTTVYTTTGSPITKSMFEVDSSGNLYAGNVNVKGRVYAESGYIGNGTNGFTINSTSIINGKSSLYDNAAGIYLGTDGIALGANNVFSVTKAGVINATSGYIGGAKLSNNSIYAENGNWGINSNGYAYFKNVYITGVNSGSTFGNMGYNGQNYNWGTFGGSSYYGSTSGAPFSGGCVDHIRSLAVDEIIAQKAYIGWASIGELEAESANIRSLVAQEITATKLYADQIGANTLQASKVYANGVVANKITYNQAKGILTEGFYASFSGLSVGGNQLVVKTLHLASGDFDVFAPGGWT